MSAKRKQHGLHHHWNLDPRISFLNHGSFGACPKPVLEAQSQLRARMEAEPVRFFMRELEGLADAARKVLADFVKADPKDLAFIPNASSGVSTVLRSLELKPGDELLTTNHAYNACRNAMDFTAKESGAKVVVAEVPFPIQGEGQVVETVLSGVTRRTRLALLDHVTSPTGLVFPAEELVKELSRRGIDAMIDGAHAPGMIPLDLRALGAAYYTGNCHKWLCAPKGAAFLHVRRDKQKDVHPLTLSHGMNSPRSDRSRFRLEFDWTGTADPTPYLCVPEAVRFMGSLVGGGWAAVMRRNRKLALEGREILCRKLGVPPPCPDSMLGSMAALPLGPEPGHDQRLCNPLVKNPLQESLFKRYRIEVPVWNWPAPPDRLFRVSAQLYNSPAQYEELGLALSQLLKSHPRQIHRP
ncbi:MAG: aminotransferase class V-fold PLP-dependent enzyme [Elusimicrobia bacterium]|nr:aminotransferase class V-fold PLP-dependent enzyme [Elusimicrobiota bacterium]